LERALIPRQYYAPDYELDVRSSNMENANSYEYLDKIKIAVIENLKRTAPVPSVQMQNVPSQSLGMTDEEEAELDDLDEDENKDTRVTQRQWEKNVTRQDEFEESDDEDMGRANGVNYDGPPRRSIMDYRNPHADYEADSGAASPNGRASPAPDGEAPGDETEEVAMEDTDPAAPPALSATAVDKDGDVDMDSSEAPIKTEDAESTVPTQPSDPPKKAEAASEKSLSTSAADSKPDAKTDERDAEATRLDA